MLGNGREQHPSCCCRVLPSPTSNNVILSGASTKVFRLASLTSRADVESKSLFSSTVLFGLLLLVTVFVVSTAAAQAAAPAAQQPPTWNQIQPPPLPAFKPVEPTRIQLANGMVIFLQEDHELPLIGASARIRGGSIYEPAAKVGLVDLYGDVWRTGGTKSKTGDEMDDFLEARAAKIETGGQGESTTMGMNCLKADFDAVFAMFLDLLRNPEFRADKLELAQQEMFAGIARRNDSVDGIAARESLVIAYGKDNPYARIPEYSTVAAVTREDLVKWHQQYVQPNNIIVGISGDFDAKAMEAKLRQAFESWPKGSAAQRPDIKFTPPKPGYYLVRKTDVNQSSIDMLDLGIERDNPDFYAVSVMNEILGGGFSSRLFNNIRATKGLAYNVGGGVGYSYSHVGLTNIEMQTKSTTTVEGILALGHEIDDIHATPPTAAEMKRAKDNILNSFVFNFDTPEKVLREKMQYEFYHYPLDFLERYRTEVEKVTAADVERVSQKYLHKDKLAVLVVGNDAEFDKPLSTLGPVTNVDIAIPPPPASMMGGQQGGPGDHQ